MAHPIDIRYPNRRSSKLELSLCVWDKQKEKNGKNKAIYTLRTSVKEQFETVRFMRKVIENLLDCIDSDRFIVSLQANTWNENTNLEAMHAYNKECEQCGKPLSLGQQSPNPKLCMNCYLQKR